MAVHLSHLKMSCQNCYTAENPFCSYEQKKEIWEIKGERYLGCPFQYVTRKSTAFIKAFRFYKQGFWPNAGGWLEQPAKLTDVFDVIEKELNEIEEHDQ